MFDTVWETLDQKNKVNSTASELTEEFEDANGNVFSRKTYEDLKRQGLL